MFCSLFSENCVFSTYVSAIECIKGKTNTFYYFLSFNFLLIPFWSKLDKSQIQAVNHPILIAGKPLLKEFTLLEFSSPAVCAEHHYYTIQFMGETWSLILGNIKCGMFCFLYHPPLNITWAVPMAVHQPQLSHHWVRGREPRAEYQLDLFWNKCTLVFSVNLSHDSNLLGFK